MAAAGQRAIRPEDAVAGLRLSRLAGWNQTIDDWRLMLSFGRGFAVERRGVVVATAMTLPYGKAVGWISMVLVDPEQRRQGLATDLMRDCISLLASDGLAPVLDATPAGREVYLKLDFRDGWGFRRWSLSGAAAAAPAPALELRPITEQDWPAIAALDLAAFGADRVALLRHLAARLPPAAVAAWRDGALAGFGLGRDGVNRPQIGPLVAGDDAIAIAIAAAAVRAVGEARGVYVDAVDRRAGFSRWLQEQGGTVERPFTRMACGRDGGFGDPALLAAVVGPEFG